MSSPSICSRLRMRNSLARLRFFGKSCACAITPLFLCTALSLSSCSNSQSQKPPSARIYEAWDVINQPSRFGRQFETQYSKLPKSGRLNTIPWSDSYWPTRQAGIALRWLDPSAPPFRYPLLSRQAIRDMTKEQIAKLSPAEKLDIYLGRFDFPTVRSERMRTSPGAASWEGLCHGWAPAALEFQEPQAITLTGAENIQIPFGSSDVKALLSWFMALHNNSGAIGLGGRCNFTSDLGMTTAACRDSNAGAFHIVLTNLLGKYREGFVIDIARAAQVWNQPVFGFSSRELSRQPPSLGAAPGTRQEVVVESEVEYTAEIEPQWNSLGQQLERQRIASIRYRYRLELDAQGLIRGGEWLQEDRPDFLWLQKKGNFSGDLKAIEKIYQSSLARPVVTESTAAR